MWTRYLLIEVRWWASVHLCHLFTESFHSPVGETLGKNLNYHINLSDIDLHVRGLRKDSLTITHQPHIQFALLINQLVVIEREKLQ